MSPNARRNEQDGAYRYFMYSKKGVWGIALVPLWVYATTANEPDFEVVAPYAEFVVQ